MQHRVLFFIILTSIIVTSCAIKVRTLHEPRVDFSRYKTFCWLQGCEFTFEGPGYLQDSVTRARIQKAITETMERKGFVYNNNTPDLLLGVQVLIETDTAFIYRRGEEDMIQPFISPEEVPILKGTLVIDMVDQKTSLMVWRSVALSYFDVRPSITEENIGKGVRKALKNFPPKSNVTGNQQSR